MSIFAKPSARQENEYGVKILYLHGLEGSSEGSKATHLREQWAAFTPNLRTQHVADLRNQCGGDWSRLNIHEVEESVTETYNDALDAVNYLNPDIIVGSSLGAAILYKLCAEGRYDGVSVFLAPAIPSLLTPETLSKGRGNIEANKSFWVLGEVDTIVSNADNVQLSSSVNGNILYSPGDAHKLEKALNSGLIDAVVLTAIESLNGR